MAKAKLQGITGNFSPPDSVGGDFVSWDIEVAQPVEETTSYADAGAWSTHLGSGIFTARITAAFLACQGAAGTDPNFTALTGAGSAFTATAATGCTFTGSAIIESARLSHRKIAATMPGSITARVTGTLGKAWATS